MTKTRVLFVCLGNICRSPTAEGIFREVVKRRGTADRFVIDSAGTGSWHIGHPPDRRMQRAAKKHGYSLTGSARQVREDDFERFDVVLAMDRDNHTDLSAMCPPGLEDRLRLFRSYDEDGADPDTPDPYYGGPEGFDEVVRIVERCCERLADALENE
jgi:protein-tyrosine phosphatase